MIRKFFSIYNNRINNLSLIVLLIAVLILSKFFSIQVINKNSIKEIVHNKGYKKIIEYGERGTIKDKNNKELAISGSKYTFWINTNKQEENDKTINLFSEHFNKPIEYYSDKLNKKSNYIELEKNVPFLNAEKILNNLKEFPGLNVDELSQRFYPYDELGSQTLGYVNRNNIGVGGIEGQFDNILCGDTITFEIRKGPKGKYYKNYEQINNIKNGNSITLTIDIELQKILQEELNKTVKKTNAKNANGIIMDPFSGDILAMSTIPAFDPNYFYNYDISYYKNRAISDGYEPGSTFKLIAASTIIDINLHEPRKKFDCENGSFILANKKKLRDHEAHGLLTIPEIFSFSSNIGFSKITNDLEENIFYKYCKLFGFGTRTGIALNDESKGNIRNLEDWSKTSKTYISIGQEVSVTTLQIALAYSAIANGGYLLQPNIVKNIYTDDNKLIYQNKIKPIRKVVKDKTSKEMLKMLKEVVDYGTAKNLELKGFNVGGKTGTAQKFINGAYSKDDFISSFASVFPINNPKYVLIITIDSPKYGYHWANESAVPATKEVIKRIFVLDQNLHTTNNSLIANNFYKKTDTSRNNVINAKNINLKKENSYIAPDLRGKSLKEALNIANSRGLKLKPYDNKISGRIIWQSIPPGKNFEENEICMVRLKI